MPGARNTKVKKRALGFKELIVQRGDRPQKTTITECVVSASNIEINRVPRGYRRGWSPNASWER